MGSRRHDDMTAVADSVVGLVQAVRSSKAKLLAAARTDVESAAQLLLRTVAHEGPMRASAMAELVHLDLSTVSRQTSALVSRGLLERRADPEDGRASLLALTDAGHDVLAAQARTRQSFFEDVLAGWKVADLHRFAELLERFTADYQDTHLTWAERARTDRREPALQS
jgi:DNA-binding MarR family transcriptional regulator